jgi:hypothetical protein
MVEQILRNFRPLPNVVLTFLVKVLPWPDGSPKQIEAHVGNHDVHPNMTTWCSDWHSQLNDVAVQKVMCLSQNIVFDFHAV